MNTKCLPLLTFGRDRVHHNTSRIFVSFEVVLSLFFLKVLSCPFFLLLYVSLLAVLGNLD